MATDSWQDVLKVAVPAGLIAGAAVGMVARISMRGFALATGEVPTFSLGGTAAVIGVLAVVPVPLFYGCTLGLIVERLIARA